MTLPACLRVLIMARIVARERVLIGSRNGVNGPCRLWTGARSKGGKRPSSGPYGSIWIPGVGGVRVHVAAAWVAGIIPEPRVPAGMNLDHRCERTLCVETNHYALIPAVKNRELRWSRRQQRRAA
jgi:hypothetical protein